MLRQVEDEVIAEEILCPSEKGHQALLAWSWELLSQCVQ